MAGIGIKGEGGGLFVVEGTAANHIASRTLQGSILRNDLFQGISQNYFLNKAFRNQKNTSLFFVSTPIYDQKTKNTFFLFKKSRKKVLFSKNCKKENLPEKSFPQGKKGKLGEKSLENQGFPKNPQSFPQVWEKVPVENFFAKISFFL
jgi:hypothetical protein